MTDLEIRGVLLHEELHCSLLHPLRLTLRPLSRYPRHIVNVAADYIINGKIRRMNGYGIHFVLPSDAMFHPVYLRTMMKVTLRARVLLRMKTAPKIKTATKKGGRAVKKKVNTEKKFLQALGVVTLFRTPEARAPQPKKSNKLWPT
jgi:hypothetical protein